MPIDPIKLAESFNLDPAVVAQDYQARQAAADKYEGQNFASKYTSNNPSDIGIIYSPQQDPYELLGQHQDTWGELVAPAMANLSGSFINSVGQTAGTIVAGVPTVISRFAEGKDSNEALAAIWDNPVNEAFDNWSKKLSAEFPVYYTQDEKNAGILETLFSKKFVANEAMSGIGYLLGAYASGLGIAKAFGGLRGNAMIAESLALGEGEALSAASQLTRVQDLARGTALANLKDYSKQLAVAGIMAAGEASAEANGVKQEVVRRLEEARSNGENAYTDDEILGIARGAGNTDFLVNLPMIMASDVMLFGKGLMGKFKSQKLALGKIEETGKILAPGVAELAAKPISRLGSFGKAIAVDALSEGSQEYGQMIAEKSMTDYYSSRFNPEAGAQIGDIFNEMLSTVKKNSGDKDVILGAVLGGLLGGGAAIAGQIGEGKKVDEKTQKAVSLLNDMGRMKKLGESKEALSQILTASNKGKQAIINNDKHEFENANYDEIKSYVKAMEEVGATEVFIKRLEALKTISPAQFKEQFGIISETEFTEADKIERIDNMINAAKKVAKIHQDLKVKYPGATKPVFDAVFDAATNFENIDSREAALAMEIQKEVPAFDYQELRKELQSGNKENYRKLLNEWIGVIKNSNPMKYDEIKEKLADLEKLADRREFYINQFNEALKNPGKIEEEVKPVTTEEPAISLEDFKSVEMTTSEFEEVNKINEKYTEYTQPVPEVSAEANVAAFKTKLTNLRKLKQEVQSLLGITEQELVKEELAKSLKVINDAINFFEKNQKTQEEKVKTNIEASRPLVKGTKRLQDILQKHNVFVNKLPRKEYIPGITREGMLKIANIPWAKLRNKISFEILDYAPEEQYSSLTDEDGVFPDNFKIKNGISVTMPNGSVVTKSILLKVDGIDYGYLLDPDRFVVATADGKYVPLTIDENFPEHLKLFRPEFVNNGKVTNAGLKFIHNYKSQKAAFDYIKTQIAAGLPINRTDLLKLVDFEFNAVLEDIETPVPIVEHLKASGDKYKTEYTIGGKKIVLGPLVYNGKNKQLDEPYFYEFDGEKFVPISNQNGIDSEDITNYLIKHLEENKVLQGKIETLGNSLVALLLKENGQDFVVGMKFGEEFPNAGNDFLQSIVSMVNEVVTKVKSGTSGNIFQTLQKKVVFETDYGIKNTTEQGKRKYVSIKLVADKWSDKPGKTPYRMKLRVSLPHIGKEFSIQLQSMDEKHPGFVVKDDKLFIKQGKEIEEVTTTEQFLEALNVIVYNQTEAYFPEIKGLQIQRISTPPESNPETLGGAYLVKDLLTTIRFTAKEEFQAPIADKEPTTNLEVFGIKPKEEKKEPAAKETVSTEELSAEDINVLTKNMNGFATLTSAEQIYFSKNLKRLASYVKDDNKLFKEYLANKKETTSVEKPAEIKKEEIPVDKKADIERRRETELNSRKQGLTREFALEDAEKESKQLSITKEKFEKNKERVEALEKFISFLLHSETIEDAHDKFKDSFTETTPITNRIAELFNSIFGARNNINAKYDAELKALEESTVSTQSNIEVKKVDIEKEYEKGDYAKVLQLVRDTINGKQITTPESLQLLTNYPKLFEEYIKIERRRNEELPIINVYWGSAETPTNTRVLSNLAPRKFTYNGKEYGSVEHAYQTLKSGEFDQSTYDKYVKVGGYGTKIRGKAVNKGFDNLQLMKDLVVQSFKQNPEQAKLLLKYKDFTHTTNEIIDKAFLEGLKLAKYDAEIAALEQPKTKDLGDAADFDEAAPFKLSTEEGTRRELSEAEENLISILPIKTADNPNGIISLREIEDVNDNLASKNYTWGRLIGNVIELAKKRGKGVEFHEAFHGVFRILLNREQRQAAYKAALNKYGKPSNATLIEFKNEHSSRINMTIPELTLLWLEEQMADDYQGSELAWRKMGILEKVFNKLKRLAKAIFDNHTDLELLFQDISKGRYKKANPSEDVIYGTAYKLIKGIDNTVINEAIISRIVRGVLVKKLVNGKFTIEDVRTAASNLREGYYSVANFDELIKQAKKNVDKKKLVTDDIKAMLSDVREALSSEENITLLYTIAKERILTRETEIDDLDFEAEKDTPLDFATKEASERGGIAAGTKRMKEYLSTVLVGVDEFQIGLTESQLDEPQHQVYANPYMLHNSLDRSLTDTKKQDLLRKLYLISKDNRLLRAFYKRLANDINKDLKLNLSKYELEERIAEMSSLELSGSVHYNMLVASYNKIRGNRNKTLVDLKTGEDRDIASYRSMRSNLTDIQEVITNQWRSSWNSLRLDEREKFVKESLIKIQDIFLSYNKFINVAKREESIDELQNLFSGLGIDLSRAYIKYSWANSWWTKSEQPNKLQTKFVETLSKSESHVVDEVSKIFEELSAFAGVGFITWEDTQNFIYTAKGGGLHKKITEEVSDVAAEENTVTEGATSRLKRIALGNSVFDETVQPVTIKNFEGKTIYLNLFPNYMFYETLLWRLGDRIKAFKEDESLFKALYTEDQQLEEWMYDVYKQALNHNHLLTHENAVEFFEQFFVNINEGIVKTNFNAAGEQSFLGDDREVPYQKTADAEFYALQLAYFADETRNDLTKKVKGQRYAPFITLQNSNKNTQLAVTLPVLEVTKGAKLTQMGIDAIVNYIKQEHERIHKEFKGPKVLGWNDTQKGRKSDFWNFLFLKEISPDLYSRLLTDRNFPTTEVAEIVPLLLEKRYSEYKEALIEEELITEEGKNVRLPQFYLEDGKVSDKILFDFFVNNYLNSLAFNNLMFGDMSMRFKNFLDFVKRAPGAFASGPSMVDGFSTIKVVPDVKSTNKYIPGETNTTDGQGWNTVEWFSDVYLTGLSKSDVAIQAVFKKIKRGYVLNTEEYNILKNNHALVGSKKISMFDMMFYFKGSLDTLMRSVVSAEPTPEDRIALDELYDRLEGGENVIEEINALWKPAPGRSQLHNQLNQMYSEGIALQVSQSTIKTQVALNVPLKISNDYIREQLVTDGFKDYIPGGVQKIQLMASEQADVETTFGGRKTTFKQMGEMYDGLLALKQKFSYNYLTKLLFKGEGIPNYEYLVTLFNNTLDELGEDTMFKKQFTPSEDGKGFKFNFNNLNVLKKSEQIFNSIVNKMTFEQNVPGHKLTLKSANGYNVIRDKKGVVIPSYITRKNYEKYKDYEETPLRILTDENGVTYAECIITEQTAKRYGYTKGMNIEFIGSRIPTDDKHSLAYLKVVDVLPKETGNQIILPFELIDAAGHDFDIDSEFLESGSFFMKGNKITYFGEYLKTKKTKDAVKAAFDEYIEGASEYDLRVELAYKKAVEDNEELNALITKADNMIINKKIIMEETGQEPVDVLYSDDFAIDKLLLSISEVAGIDSYGDITYNKEELKKILLEIKELKQILKTTTLNSLGYATSLEDFTKQFSKQIESNRIAYTKGLYNSISPITLGEVNQLLFDIGKQLIHNPGNTEIAKEATSREVVIKLREKYKDILSNLGVVKDINSSQSLAKVKNFTSTGAANIGIAAQNLIMFQYLAKSDARNRNTPDVRSFEFGSGPTRRNSMMSLHVTIEVDAGTHNDPAYFNLTEDTLAPYILRNMKGETFEETFLWNIQPAMLELSKKLAKAHTIFAGVEYAGAIIKGEKQKYKNKTIDYKGKFKTDSPSVEQLASLLRNEAVISQEDRDYIQFLAVSKFEESWKENQYLRNLTNIIGLAKGMKPTFAEMSVIDDSLEKLGVVEYNGKLVHSVAFLNDLENYPYDGLEIIQKSPFLNQLLLDYLKYKKDSGYFFISQSPFGKEAMKRVKELVKFYKKGDETVFNNINRLLISFLENKRMRQLGKTVKPDDFLGIDETPIAVDLFRILKSSEQFKNNKFLNALDVESYAFKKEGILQGRKLHHFVINSRVKKDPYYQEQMMNNFDALLKTKKYKNVTTSEVLTKGAPTSLNDIAKIFAQKLIEISIFKDALAYKNRSYAQYIDPELLPSFNRALNDILNSSNLKNSFKDIYGEDFENLSDEFIEYAGRDYALKDDYTYSSKADLFTARKQSWINSAALILLETEGSVRSGETLKAAKEKVAKIYDKEKNNISEKDFAIDVQDEKIVVNLYANAEKVSKDTAKSIVASNVAEIKNKTKLFKEVARLDNPAKVGLMPLPFVYIRTDKGIKVFRLASYKESGLKALNKDEFIVNKAEYLLDSVLGHKDIMSTALPLEVWEDMQKNPVIKKEQVNKYQKQIEKLYGDIMDFPEDVQKKALEIIEDSKVTTDEEMGELINKICNLGK